MNAVVFIVDRREAYYSRAALHIAADPLDFYTRAERGRRYTGASLPTPTWQAPVLPSPRCPGSGLAGVEAHDIQSTPEWGDFESAAEEEAFWREHA